ncbi:hypothetical protein ANAEL_02759 [Anaerolineales bacterium]|nr:hypothetical protein ANAEL_02759 [Anaerolineales bacterium]
MDIKQEVRALNASAELIESYVNYSVCCFPEDRTKIVTTVLPKDHIAKKYFFILLLEVIEGVHKEMIPSKRNGDGLLDLLHRIATSPVLDEEFSSTSRLLSATEDFISWLNHEFEYEIYSANIGKEIRIKLTRRKAIYLIGNRCKHSLLRSNSILNQMVKIYKNSGVELDTGTELLILEDIDNWLFDDFGGYHFTKLCELSSKVHHGIMQYIDPMRRQRLEQIDEVRYAYKIPPSLTEEESKFEFYELLNRARSPFIPTIKTCKHLEEKY